MTHLYLAVGFIMLAVLLIMRGPGLVSILRAFGVAAQAFFCGVKRLPKKH